MVDRNIAALAVGRGFVNEERWYYRYYCHRVGIEYRTLVGEKVI